jgi:hypothetical protein
VIIEKTNLVIFCMVHWSVNKKWHLCKACRVQLHSCQIAYPYTDRWLWSVPEETTYILCLVKIKWITSSQPLVEPILLNLQITTSKFNWKFSRMRNIIMYLHQLTYQVHIQCTLFLFVKVYQWIFQTLRFKGKKSLNFGSLMCNIYIKSRVMHNILLLFSLGDNRQFVESPRIYIR